MLIQFDLKDFLNKFNTHINNSNGKAIDNENWPHLPFPNEYVKMITELLRASFSVLITSNGSASELLAAKNNMMDSEKKKER